jgi:hypothetical protein
MHAKNIFDLKMYKQTYPYFKRNYAQFSGFAFAFTKLRRDKKVSTPILQNQPVLVYNGKKVRYKSSFSAALTLFCIFYFINENSLFSLSSNYSPNSERSLGLGKARDAVRNPADNKGANASIGEDVNYFKGIEEGENIPLISHVPIKHISEGIDFRSLNILDGYQINVHSTGGLTVIGYQILITDLISKKYPALNIHSSDSKYFFRALAENMYSLNGYISADEFNSIVDARATCLKVSDYIDTLKVSPDIKSSLKQLYIYTCIYMQAINESIKTLKKLKNIPVNSVIYELKNYGENTPLGELVGGTSGENIYYICAAFYDKFTDLSKEKQMEVLDHIYSFNPTVQIAPQILSRYDFFHWILSFFYGKPKLLKYCVRDNIGWFILPKTIHLNSNTESRKNVVREDEI